MNDQTEQQEDTAAHFRVERVVVPNGSHNHKACGVICQKSRRIKNAAHYAIRHLKKDNGKSMTHRDADKHLKCCQPDLYRKLPSAIAQRMTQIAGQEWSSYWDALSSYKADPSKFQRQPKPPGYANKATTTYIGRNGFCIKSGMLAFPKELGLVPISIKCHHEQPFNESASKTVVREVRIVPKGSCYVIEVVYDSSMTISEGSFCPLLDKKRIAAVDIGVNNLCTIVTNQPDIRPVLVSGRPLKAVNQRYNKQCADIRSRNKKAHLAAKGNRRYRRVQDYLHKVSRFVVNHCVENEIGVLVIGKSHLWKKGVELGSVNNQTFTSIPHARLVDIITYKAKSCGITVVIREESYTSKASALDFDMVPTYGDKTVQKFSGRRIRRGLYKASSGLVINADVNGALNIMRKHDQVIGDEAVKSLVNSGCVFQPVSISIGESRSVQNDTRRMPRRVARKATLESSSQSYDQGATKEADSKAA